MQKIKGLELRTFLKDYENSSNIEFLEEGKEKSDLIQSAKKRGILVENSRDLGLLKTIYCFTDKPNSNGAIVPSNEFQKKLPQIIGKPMNQNHIREKILGFYIDYRYILKENKAITYAVFFKSNYPDEWKEAKTLQKKGKLSSSFEIWSPITKKDADSKGDFVLKHMELAGGALLYEDEDIQPSFKDAKVLSIAKKELPNYVQEKYLVYASKSIKAKSEEIITADWALDEVKKNAEKLAKEKEERLKKETDKVEKPKDEKTTDVKPKNLKPEDKEIPKEEVKKDVQPEEKKEKKVEDIVKPEPTVPKIKCSNCEEEIEVIEGQVEIKCPKCLSILDSTGKVKYPPQIKDFKLSCTCGARDWLILENNNEHAKLRCLSCAKEVNVKFRVKSDEKSSQEEVKVRLNFLYQSFATCFQCGHRIPIVGTSKIDVHELTCPKCGLHFKFNKAKNEKYRQIEEVNEIIGDKIEKSSENGGDKKMEIDKKIVDAVEKQETKKVEEPTKEVEEKKVEEKLTEVEVEKNPKSEDALKEETPVTEIVEDKETPEEETVTELEKTKNTIEEIPKEEVPEEEKVEPQKSSVIRKAVKKIIDLKKNIKKTKTDAENETTKLKEGIKKVASQLIEAQVEIKKIKKEAGEKIKFYSENAKEIIKRKIELGETFSKDLSDEEILDNDKFANAKLEKENTLLRAKVEGGNDVVSDKSLKRDEEWYSNTQKKIDSLAFGRNSKEKK
jgi:hypothetical protein